MESSTVKEEIKKVIDTMPEDTLEGILGYLKSIQNTSGDAFQKSQHLKKILSEDKELLEMLAK